jgi:N-acetyl-gamma-glutamylphosphate reductase
MPEVTQELTALSPNGEVTVTLVSHPLPMTRGILATCCARLHDVPAAAQVGARQLAALDNPDRGAVGAGV